MKIIATAIKLCPRWRGFYESRGIEDHKALREAM